MEGKGRPATTGPSHTYMNEFIQLVDGPKIPGGNGSGAFTYRKIKVEKAYTKGNTSYGTVTSQSQTAHESGKRNSDGYWYVSISPQ